MAEPFEYLLMAGTIEGWLKLVSIPFGAFTPLFFALVGTLLLMRWGGLQKGLYGGIFLFVFFILLTYWWNSIYNLGWDMVSLVIGLIFISAYWILLLRKV